MGPQTQQAIQQFQSQQQLPPTGALDPQTMNALQAACGGGQGGGGQAGPSGPGQQHEYGTAEEGEFPGDYRFRRGDRFRDHWRRDRDHGWDRRWPFLFEGETGGTEGEGEYRRYFRRPFVQERRIWNRRWFFGLPEHHRISWAQSCLAQILGSWVVQDGAFGPNTAHALRKFQEQNGLPVSGALDEATAQTLHQNCGA